MRRLLLVFLALTLVLGLSSGWGAVVAAAAPASPTSDAPAATAPSDAGKSTAATAATDAPAAVTLSDAESLKGWNGYRFYNVCLDYRRVKQGNSSVRVDTVHGQTVVLLQFDAAKDLTALGTELYLELWVYVVNAVEHNKSYQAAVELSSNFNNDDNSYYWNMVGYRYRTGWNHLSLKLAEGNVYGKPDLSAMKSLRYTVFVPVETSIYFDDVRVTAAPTTVDEAELGTSEAPAPFVKNEVRPPEYSPLTTVAAIALALAGLSGAAFVAALIPRLRRRTDNAHREEDSRDE